MNNNKNLVAVVIPFHKSEMSEIEEVSFINNTKILNRYPIYLLLPEGTNADRFLQIAPNIRLLFFHPRYFSSYSAANHFWIQKDLYDYFKQFKFILKCELDSYVFKDELEYWCARNYDYIGAPWIDSKKWIPILQNALHSENIIFKKIKYVLSKRTRSKNIFVGNSGLSLRKVSVFRLVSRLLPLFIPNLEKFSVQEDFIWSFYVASYFSFFNIPDYKEALQFSIETEPRECYRLNNYQLPFGCHAWEKYDMDFWKNHMKV
ncbi:hypothetical protein OKW21_000479 [Catalinimonas alkaloidigena]|uniref:DUF5672 family protein n=1 Tax=Catalinimonas alkaloidigena TaxID=1075417 RepID=UPI002405C9D2|nr:DUF5672 family protein [Catalinimonas alkaloidigena]MDF9795216.1 hypothetical protein [Catalinimonas alkaloidigena]